MTFEYKLYNPLQKWAAFRPDEEIALMRILIRHSRLERTYTQKGGREISVYTLSDRGVTELTLKTYPRDMIRVLKLTTALVDWG
jgi:hypothetical protein